MLDNWQNYGRNTFQYNNFRYVTGDGLLTTDGDFWLRHRRLAQPRFHRQRLVGLVDNMVAVIARMMKRWDALAQAGESLDIDEEMMRVALEVVGQALFSIDLTDEAHDLAHDMLALLDYVVFRAKMLIAPPPIVPTPRNIRFRRNLKKFDKLIYGLISQRRAQPTSDDDLLNMLLLSTYTDGSQLTDKELRDECLTMLIAGYEPVAAGLTWSFYLLSQHAEVQAKLEAEVDKLGHVPHWGDMGALGYTEQVFTEALRLYPPNWILTRQALAADEIGGYFIPAKALVVISSYAVHHNTAVWPSPYSFDPDRFTTDKVKERSKFAHLAFGGGPHLCIGKDFAIVEAKLILATVAQKYRLVVADGVQVEPFPQVTIRPKYGLRMNLVKRSAE
jgi:cytochrome P450